LVFTNQSIPSNPLTQFNYTSLQLKEYNPIATSLSLSGGKSFDVGSEESLVFRNCFFNNDFSSKSNGTAKASVNGNGLLIKFSSYTDLKYD
jgi:hypothetical protein